MPSVHDIIGPSDLSQPHIPNRADIERIADDTIAVIARDWAKQPDARLRQVLRHWLITDMTEVRNKTLDHQATRLRDLASALAERRNL